MKNALVNTHLGIASEAVLLGLASGPACIASCGPLLVPWSIEQRQRVSGNAIQLGLFVAARFAGYLVFAVAAYTLGLALPASRSSSLAYGIGHLALGAVLALYALGQWRRGGCAAATAVAGEQQLVTIGGPPAPSRLWAPLFGFLTGLSLCPPFLVAGMRVMELRQFALALLFFTMFFVGTLAWFVPFLTLGFVRWKDSAIIVSRIMLFLLAGYYGYLGTVILIGRLLHG